MLDELREGEDEFNKIFSKEIENIKKDIETIKKNQSEMMNIITEMKNTLEGINSKLDEEEDWISNFKERVAEKVQSEQQKEKRITKHEESLKDFWDNVKCNNIHIIEISEGEKIKQGIENLFEEIMTENFSNLMKEIDRQVQES